MSKVANRPHLEKRGRVVINKDEQQKRQYLANKKRAQRLKQLEDDVEMLKAMVLGGERK